MTKRYVIATIEVPDRATIAETIQYVVEELKAAGGCRRSDNPLFESIAVVSIGSTKLVKS